ncbi:MAG: ribosome maturation factor RimM [Ignavibacteriaceae bacterium]|nr:ribosome maturation factor RimM [Ignavibacteriaceae bacterium]
MNNFYLIATVTSVSGKNGAVKIISHSDYPERFFNLSKVYIDFFGEKKLFFVKDVKQHKNLFTLKFKNFDSELDSAILVGKDIFVDEENLVSLPDNHFFIHDLIGSRVIKNDKELGIIKDVLKYPANDVYVIEDSTGKEILIPALLNIIESFDKEKKELKLKPGEDLYEDDES